jgi:hypothetical protein
MSTPTPKTRRPLKALIIALVLGAAALFGIILPAERGFDPTGIGRLLGLTALNPTNASASAEALKIEDVSGGNDNLVAAEGSSARDPLPLPNPAIHQKESQLARTETFSIKLGLDEKTEIKAVLGKAKSLHYEWSVEGGQVYVDFHGHDPAKGDAYWVRYDESDGVSQGQGSLVAPFSGEHGWFWLNVSEGPITIHLKVSGFQEKMINYGLIP